MIMTNNRDLRLRLPAEWERQDGILIAWPHENTDWSYMLDEVTECFTAIAKAIAAEEKLLVVAPGRGDSTGVSVGCRGEYG